MNQQEMTGAPKEGMITIPRYRASALKTGLLGTGLINISRPKPGPGANGKEDFISPSYFASNGNLTARKR